MRRLHSELLGEGGREYKPDRAPRAARPSAGIGPSSIHFLAKPFTRDSLLEKVRDVLASPELGDVRA
jgi:hypothetical protein